MRETMKGDYQNSVYFTEWDEIVWEYIRQREPFAGYWYDESENRILDFIAKSIHKKPMLRLLDLGCGQGRLLLKFADKFEQIVAIDSEKQRIEDAKKVAAKGEIGKYLFVNNVFEECADQLGQFDMILCSHVIQHLPTNRLSVFFEKVHTVLNPGGILALFTSHSRASYDTFKYWQIDSGNNRVNEIIMPNEDMFNSALCNSSSKAQVPMHSFSINNIHRLLLSFNIKHTYTYHSLFRRSLLDSICFRDSLLNFPVLRNWFGIDMFLLAEKKTS